MQAERIKELLAEKGCKVKEVAEMLVVPAYYVSLTINGHKRYQKIRDRIAEILGLEVSDIWPEPAPINPTEPKESA